MVATAHGELEDPLGKLPATAMTFVTGIYIDRMGLSPNGLPQKSTG